MALDCAGGWGPAMMKYFREASSEYGKRYINEDEKDKQMRYIKEGISLAITICKANAEWNYVTHEENTRRYTKR